MDCDNGSNISRHSIHTDIFDRQHSAMDRCIHNRTVHNRYMATRTEIYRTMVGMDDCRRCVYRVVYLQRHLLLCSTLFHLYRYMHSRFHEMEETDAGAKIIQ